MYQFNIKAIIKDKLTARWKDIPHQVWKGLQGSSFYHQQVGVYNPSSMGIC